MTLELLFKLLEDLQAQGILTIVQLDKLKIAATSMLSNFSNAEEYQQRFALFLALLGGKWI